MRVIFMVCNLMPEGFAGPQVTPDETAEKP